MIKSIKDLAEDLEVSVTTIQTRIKELDIVKEIIPTKSGRPVWAIDIDKYPIKLFTAKKRGRKPKNKLIDSQ